MTDLFVNDQCVLKDVQLVLLDKDGTIIDIHHYWGSMLKERAQITINHWFADSKIQKEIHDELIDAMGFDLVNKRMKPEGPVGVKPRTFIVKVATEVVCRNGVSIVEEEIEKLFKIVDRQTETNILPSLKVLPGVNTFIKKCYKLGVQIGVVTTDITQRGIKALQALEIDHCFQYVVGSDQVKNHKPASDSVDIILEKSGLSRDKTVVIGDHVVDVEMGIKSAVGCNIGVLTGLGSQKSFTNFSCHLINSFNELSLQR